MAVLNICEAVVQEHYINPSVESGADPLPVCGWDRSMSFPKKEDPEETAASRNLAQHFWNGQATLTEV